MAKTETIRARVDTKVKSDAEKIFRKLGLSASDAIRIFYTHVTLSKGLPFDVRIPNAETRKAMRDADAGRGLRSYKNTQEMFDKLGLSSDVDE